MGKRGGKHKQKPNTNSKEPQKEVKYEDWRSHKVVHQNTYFRRFYELQFEPYFKQNPSEFSIFWQHMKMKLPVVFRINPNQPNYTYFKNKLMSE